MYVCRVCSMSTFRGTTSVTWARRLENQKDDMYDSRALTAMFIYMYMQVMLKSYKSKSEESCDTTRSNKKGKRQPTTHKDNTNTLNYKNNRQANSKRVRPTKVC